MSFCVCLSRGVKKIMAVLHHNPEKEEVRGVGYGPRVKFDTASLGGVYPLFHKRVTWSKYAGIAEWVDLANQPASEP